MEGLSALSALFGSLSLLVYVATAVFAVEIGYRLYTALRRCDCSRAVEEARAAALVEARRECTERMERLCSLNEEAARILEAILEKRVLLVCPDGTPAMIIGGEVICKEQR